MSYLTHRWLGYAIVLALVVIAMAIAFVPFQSRSVPTPTRISPAAGINQTTTGVAAGAALRSQTPASVTQQRSSAISSGPVIGSRSSLAIAFVVILLLGIAFMLIQRFRHVQGTSVLRTTRRQVLGAGLVMRSVVMVIPSQIRGLRAAGLPPVMTASALGGLAGSSA